MDSHHPLNFEEFESLFESTPTAALQAHVPEAFFRELFDGKRMRSGFWPYQFITKLKEFGRHIVYEEWSQRAGHLRGGKGSREDYIDLMYWMYVDKENDENRSSIFQTACDNIWGHSFEKQLNEVFILTTVEEHADKPEERAKSRPIKLQFRTPRETRKADQHSNFEELRSSTEPYAPRAQKDILGRQTSPGRPPKHDPILSRLPLITKDHDEYWLNPFNFVSIPFVGRKRELGQLRDFTSSSERFQICAIVGPSGSGKTRLVAEFMADLQNSTDWVVGFVDNRDASRWSRWTPMQNTLIVIDYTYDYGAVIDSVIRRCQQINELRQEPRKSGKPTNEPPALKVRMLLLEHVFPDKPSQLASFGVEHLKGPFASSASFEERQNLFHEHTPIRLGGQDDVELLTCILQEVSGCSSPSDPLVKRGIDYLTNKMGKSARHPLFAVLIGRAIRDDEPYEGCKRRDLIKNYIRKEKRLPWETSVIEDYELGVWVGTLVSIATLLRGVSIRTLLRLIPSRLAPHLNTLKSRCYGIVSSRESSALKPFEPDILGETFFLEFLKNVSLRPETQQAFDLALHTTLSERNEPEIARNFLEVLQRMARNLANEELPTTDDEDLASTDIADDWANLLLFLRPDQKSEYTFLRQLRSVASIEVASAIASPSTLAIRADFLAQANLPDIADAVQTSPTSFRLVAAVAFMRAYEDLSTNTQVDPSIDQSLLKIEECFEAHRPSGTTALMLACRFNFVNSARLLISNSSNIDWANKHGLTALMFAASLDNTEIVKSLLDKGADVDRVDKDGWSALLFASSRGFGEIVDLLFSKHANVDISSLGGNTALILAAKHGHVDVVRKLLRRGPDLDKATLYGRTALICACGQNHVRIVDLLLRAGANIDLADEHGFTALFYAAAGGFERVFFRLLKKRPDMHHRDRLGHTVFFYVNPDRNYNIWRRVLYS